VFRADLYRALGDAAKGLDDGLAVLHAVSNGHTALDVERVVADTPKLREVRKIDSFTSETGLDVARRRWAQPGLLPGAIYAMTAACPAPGGSPWPPTGSPCGSTPRPRRPRSSPASRPPRRAALACMGPSPGGYHALGVDRRREVGPRRRSAVGRSAACPSRRPDPNHVQHPAPASTTNTQRPRHRQRRPRRRPHRPGGADFLTRPAGRLAA
jgi:hypothetical protein